MNTTDARELIFCNTFAHEEKEDVQLDLIQFPCPVDVHELRVVPRGQWAHQDLKEDFQFGQTVPSTLKVEFFFKSCKNDPSAIYQKMGNLEYDVEKGHIQFMPKSKITTDNIVVRGRYHKLTLSIYGAISSKREGSESPPPPPPPPPVKAKPAEEKAPVEEISQIETIKSTSRPSDWDWDVAKSGHPEDPQFTDFPVSQGTDTLALEPKPVEPPHPPPIRRGPRTPSPPPPTEQWEGGQQEPPRGHWSEGEAVSPGEWQTQDLWVEGQNAEPPPPSEEPTRGTWEGPEGAWQTTDTWEPQDTGGDWEDQDRSSDDWKKEQGDRRRKNRGPRTPPGEPRSPKSYESSSRRKRRRPREPEPTDTGKRQRRRKQDGFMEPLSPERSGEGFPSGPPDQEDLEGEEQMGESYEEISDEEVIDEGFLENMDIYSLDTGGDVIPFDPFQAELEPLKFLGSLEHAQYRKLIAESSPSQEDVTDGEGPGKESKLQDILESIADDRGPKWVAALEEIPKLLGSKPLREDETDIVCDWTIQALDYALAQKQPIAVNIRQIKAGLKLVTSLCSCGEQTVTKLVNREVLRRLLSLLFEDHMASSLKIFIFKAINSSTNWQVGLDKFLSTEDQGSNGYKKLLKFLMTEQTVRVTQAGTALLQKIHLYEIMGTLKDTVNNVVLATPVKQDNKATDPVTPGDGSRPPGSMVEDTPDVKAQPVETDYPSLDETIAGRLLQCLEEILSVFDTDARSLKQPAARAFPTTAVLCVEEGEDPWPTLYHLCTKRGLVPSLILLLCCPSTASDLQIVSAVTEIITKMSESFQGLLHLASQPEAVKLLYQALTVSDEEDTDDISLQQVAMEIVHKMAALRVLDSLMLKLSPGKPSELRESTELVDDLKQGFSLTFNPIGRQALADVFSKEDNLRYLLCLLKPQETVPESTDEQPKKNAVDGYLPHLIVMILQYSNDINLLIKHAETLKSCTDEKDLQKWVSQLPEGPLDSSVVRPVVDAIQGCCDDLATNSTVAPGILTCLRVLHHLTCVPETMATDGQQKILSYQLATIEAFSAGAVSALTTCVKKVSDLLLRPWQMGHCLTSKQQHLVEMISLISLKIIRVILVAVFSTGQVQFKDERPITSAISLYTVMCCAPPGGSLGKKPQEIHQLIIDILLTYTTAPPIMPDSTQAFSQGCWNMMLKLVLEYIPTNLYTFLGGLSLLSDLLPLPLPLQTQEGLSEDEVSQILQHRKLWSVHILCQGTAVKTIISQLAYTNSPVLQHMLRRVLCQIADLSATTATLVVRSILEAVSDKLIVDESGAMEPTSLEVAQVLSLLVYLTLQPSVKGAFLHLIQSVDGAEDPLADILKKLLMVMNIPSESPNQLQAQECVVASLQSLCSPDITLISDENLSMSEQLTNSLPGKDDMNLIATYLLDHVTGADHSYASILPALRMTASLLDHDYGFASVKAALLKQESILSAFYKRLTEGFSKDSSDYLSTLSTAIDLLHFLTSVESYYDEEHPEAPKYRTQALAVQELRLLVGWEGEDHCLKRLEKILVECCKEDEKLESLLDSLGTLTQLLETAEPPGKFAENMPDLPPSMTLAEQFECRITFYVSEEEDDRLVPGIWIGLPPMDEVDTEPDMVKCDLEEMRLKFFPDFNLKAELEKGFLNEERTQEKPRRTRRYTALTSRGRGQFSNTIRRAHNTGFRGGKRNYDLFRQRAQNTSRPPSMHVDDFMNMDNDSNDNNQYNRNQPSRRGDGGPPGGHRGSRGGFRTWSGPSFRRDVPTRGMFFGGRGQGPPRGMPVRGRGQWGPGRKPVRSNYPPGPPDRNYMQRRPDPRSEGRPPPRSPMGGPQAFNRPGSADRMRGPYRGGMRGMGPRGSPSPRRGGGGGGGGGGGRGYRGGHWTGDPHMRPQGKGMRGRPPPPGRHSRSFTR